LSWEPLFGTSYKLAPEGGLGGARLKIVYGHTIGIVRQREKVLIRRMVQIVQIDLML
jgi:hypothetical protein